MLIRCVGDGRRQSQEWADLSFVIEHPELKANVQERDCHRERKRSQVDVWRVVHTGLIRELNNSELLRILPS